MQGDAERKGGTGMGETPGEEGAYGRLAVMKRQAGRVKACF